MKWTRREVLWTSAVAVVLTLGAGVAMFARYGDRLTLPDGLVATLLATISESGSGNCPTDLSQLYSTGEVTVFNEGAPQDCGADDGAICALYKLTISIAPDTWGPEEDEGLDDDVGELNAWVAIRVPDEAALCSNRWMILDAGGEGLGWAPSFGKTPLGQVDLDNDFYGDDMIYDYNQAGYVTVDVAWGCDPSDGTCPSAMEGWLNDPKQGAPWTQGTGGTGPLGVVSRTLALYDWVYQNSGNRRLCAHAQSAASGRLFTALSRYGAEDLFDTVAFDGGPVWAYMPWSCGIDDGDLGARPDADQGTSGGGAPARNMDCMMSGTGPDLACAVTACTQGRPHDGLDLGSNVLADADFDFGDLDVIVVMGGADDSGAWRQVPLYLGDYADGPDQAPWPWRTRITANQVKVSQGLCNPTVNDWRCDHWDESNLTSFYGWAFEQDLKDAPHATAQDAGGAQVMQSMMLSSCELTP